MGSNRVLKENSVRPQLKCECKFRAAAVVLADTNESAMCGHDLSCERETNTRTFLFGCEEWHEDLLLEVCRYAGTVVTYLNNYIAAPVQAALQFYSRVLEVFGGLQRVA